MAEHEFQTCYEPPWNRPKSYSEDEVETAYCPKCGYGFQEPLDDDVYWGDYGESEVVNVALSQGWLRDRGHPATCEEQLVDQIHAL